MTLDDTLVLRGISILIIILHNYIHWFSNVVLEISMYIILKEIRNL